MSSLGLNSVSLAVVLVHVGVNGLNKVRADGGDKHSGKKNLTGRCGVFSDRLHRNKRS
jgi:hypothetical protein